jgi:diketogulonate reductase-like aldo/keto reductase
MLGMDSTITLNNGTKMPRLGLGVWQIADGQPTVQAVQWALDAGYRHVDTAKIYKNEASVGRAMQASKITRDKIWITTKLWPADFIHAQKAFTLSLERLGLDYVDLYLVHWPVPGAEKRIWKAMEKIYEGGRAKAIGVSNYSVHQLENVLASANVPPAVNQVKCSPFDFDKELYDACQKHHVAFEAYSPLTRGQQFGDQTLNEIAKKHAKSPAQILIRWALQKDMIVIPKSAQQEHIKQNANVFDFELSASEMDQLDNLSG